MLTPSTASISYSASGRLDANDVVDAVHPKAMPVILTTADEIDTWMTAAAQEAATCSKS